MRLIFTLILLVSFNSFSQKKVNKAIITKNINNYEIDDSYFPHDCSQESYMLKKAVDIKTTNNTLRILNERNDGYTGHELSITLNSNLDILEVKYYEWDDIEDDSETIYKVDSIKLQLNKNPFKEKEFIGYYTIYIKEINKIKDHKDKVIETIFKGKFNTKCHK